MCTALSNEYNTNPVVNYEKSVLCKNDASL
jgi:hypothetical protein